MQGAGSPLTDWINSDVKTANTISIIMIIFAAWAVIEAITNVAGIEIPPETGMATNVDPDDTQRTNNGVIVGLGAVLGTVGVIIQAYLFPEAKLKKRLRTKDPCSMRIWLNLQSGYVAGEQLLLSSLNGLMLTGQVQSIWLNLRTHSVLQKLQTYHHGRLKI